MIDQPVGIKEGIYFNLSNDDYHNDPALSHSGMTKLLQSWADYWEGSCHNPDRKKREQTEAMKFGERSGMLLLQPKLFRQTYNTYGKSKATAKGVWLSSVEYTKIHDSIEDVMAVEAGRDHFKDGYAEVAIFWRDPETGIMLRVKVDYLRTFGCIDFKRIKAVNNWAIGKAVKDQGLDIQDYLYLEGVKAARRMLKAMGELLLTELAERENVDAQWLRDFRDDEDLLFRFLFQRSTPPYVWEFRELDPDVVLEGAHAVQEALRRYKVSLERYGLGKPPRGANKVKTVSSFHVPRRDYDFEED